MSNHIRRGEIAQPIYVRVGTSEARRTFLVLEEPLTYCSSYFRTVLALPVIKGEVNQVMLPEEDPQVFADFHSWLSDKQIPNSAVTFVRVFDIYALGERLGIPDLCNSAIDAIFSMLTLEWDMPWKHWVRERLCFEFVFQHSVWHDMEYVYKNTTETSVLRKLIREFAAETLIWPSI